MLPLLRLLQLFDSQFPVGAFAHSGGVETYAAGGGGLAVLRQILEAQIELGWGRSELGGAHLAWRIAASSSASGELSRLAERIDALKAVPVVRETSLGLGRRTLDLLRRLYPGIDLDVALPHHAVVIGAAARRLGAGARELLLAYAHSLAMGTVTAGIRCMPVSPAQAQELLVGSHARMIAAVERALDAPEQILFTCTPALDISSHEQAFLHTRLFQS